MTAKKIAGTLGLIRRAGKITAGTYLVCEEIRRGKAAIVLIASDAGQDGERKLSRLAGHHGIPVRRIDLTKAQLGAAIGKKGETTCVTVPKEFLNFVWTSL